MNVQFLVSATFLFVAIGIHMFTAEKTDVKEMM
jgi:hypothetical protein